MNKNNLKVVILAGGYGTRLGTLTKLKPKPMVDVCGKPIIEHIIQLYLKSGFSNFIICGGYKIEVIKDYFKKKFKKNILLNHKNETFIKKNNFSIRIVNTGKNSNTGGRLKRLEKILLNEKNFFFTYGDGLSDLNINELLKFHIKNRTIATLTAITPPSRFGILKFRGNKINGFFEKRDFEKDYLVNGGFFVFTNEIFKYIKNDKTILEKSPIIKLTRNRQISGYKHKGFWFSMDTQRDHIYLNKLWKIKKALWKIW